MKTVLCIVAGLAMLALACRLGRDETLLAAPFSPLDASGTVSVSVANPAPVATVESAPEPILPGGPLPTDCIRQFQDNGQTLGVIIGTNGTLTIICGGHHYASATFVNTSELWRNGFGQDAQPGIGPLEVAPG